jgi:response regulator RpfG family c-di-GMP phosphodiesterase
MNKKKIVHLDDQILFLSTVQRLVKEQISGLYYLAFTDTDNAFNYITNSIDEGSPIDLIITDLNHLGMHGYEFAKQIRLLEKENSNKIPIVLLSMVLDSHKLVKRGLESKMFDHYLHKSTPPEEISALIGKCI